MPNPIETTNTEALNQISNLVSIAYDTINLSHDVISQDTFLGDANLRIKESIPTWESLTGDELLRLNIITMKLCAVNILVAFARVTSESGDGISQSRDQLSAKEAIDRYEEDIDRGILALNPESKGVDSRYIVAAIVV